MGASQRYYTKKYVTELVTDMHPQEQSLRLERSSPNARHSERSPRSEESLLVRTWGAAVLACLRWRGAMEDGEVIVHCSASGSWAAALGVRAFSSSRSIAGLGGADTWGNWRSDCESWQNRNWEPRSEVMRRAWRQSAQRPRWACGAWCCGSDGIDAHSRMPQRKRDSLRQGRRTLDGGPRKREERFLAPLGMTWRFAVNTQER